MNATSTCSNAPARSLFARLRRAWRAGRRRGPSRDARVVTLQHLGLSSDELQALQPVLRQVGSRLGVRLKLQRTHGDVVLVSQAFARDVAPQILASWREERPMVSLQALPSGQELSERAEQMLLDRQAELIEQLRALSPVQQASPHWGRDGWSLADEAGEAGEAAAAPPQESAYDAEFDTRIDLAQLSAPPLDDAQQAMVHALLRRLHDLGAGALRLSFGPRANLRLDFDARFATVDPLALQLLRVQREVPVLDDQAQPGDEATVRDLAEVVWDLGVACGAYRLIGQPDDWWHTPVEGLRLSSVAACTRLPRHLEMARLLAAGPRTPAELRRLARTSVNDVRRFVQAGLFAGSLYWAPWAHPPGGAGRPVGRGTRR
jgi:hypothetical protein